MIKQLFFLLLVSISLISCKTASTIPAQQELVLGESADRNYRATIRNIGPAEIKVAARDKVTNKQTQGFGLNRRSSAKVYLSDKEKIVFSNRSNVAVKVRFKLSEEVDGMRLQALQN